MTPPDPHSSAARTEASPPPGAASSLGHAAGGSAGGGTGFGSSFSVSLAVHGALVATLALTLRPWAAPSDAERGQEFLAQFSAPAPAVQAEPTEILEPVTPTPTEAVVPEEPLVLPEEPSPPIEAHPPRAAAPTTSNLLESVVFPKVSSVRTQRPQEDPGAPTPTAAPPEPVELPEPDEEPPGAESAPSSPEPIEGLCVPPAYPILAARRGWTGTVVLLVEVSADGSVDQVTVETSSGYAILDDAAVRAVEQWRFAPAMLAGSPAQATVRKPIRFGDA